MIDIVNLSQLEKIKAVLQGECGLILYIQGRYGLRVGEILRLKRYDISDEGIIRFRAEKGSYDRYISDPHLASWILHTCVSSRTDNLFSVSRYQYHRFLVKTFNFRRQPGRKNRRVSNQMRAEYIQRLMQFPDTDKPSVSRAVGHRSNKSIDYYT